MKYKVMYTAGAKKDLRNIFRYIGSITNFVGFRIPLVATTAHIE